MEIDDLNFFLIKNDEGYDFNSAKLIKNEENSNESRIPLKNDEIKEAETTGLLLHQKELINPSLNIQKYIENNNNINNLNNINFPKENSILENKNKFEFYKGNINNNNINVINNNDKDDKIIFKQNIPINIININKNFNFYLNKSQINKKDENNKNLIFDNFKNKNFIFKNKFIQNKLKNNNSKNKIDKKGIKLIIEDIGTILILLGNYKGSVYLQNALSYINKNEISKLLITIYPHICYIMCSEYGNYFIQKLIKKLNLKQRLELYQIIDKYFLNIATNKSGTHSIQTLIDTIQTPLEQVFLDNLLNKNMLLLFNNENSYHIIMKIILSKPENERNNINLFIVSNVEKIIINPYGAYCVNKFIINNSNLNLRFLFIKNIENNIKNLIFNKNSFSSLILSIKTFGINNLEFIIEEIKNNLSFLFLHPISNLFIIKIFYFLKNNKYYKLTSILWDIYKDENLLEALLSHQLGKKLLKALLKNSNNSQKNYVKAKYFL